LYFILNSGFLHHLGLLPRTAARLLIESAVIGPLKNFVQCCFGCFHYTVGDEMEPFHLQLCLCGRRHRHLGFLQQLVHYWLQEKTWSRVAQ